MAERRITSQDVADLAGVSRTTVSFVLNNDTRFSIRPETKLKVHEAAAKLGYVPNASARALASNQAKAIGLIMTRDTRYISSDVFLPQLIGGLLDSVKLFGISLLIEWVEPGQQLQTYHKLTGAKHIDGMILTISRYDDTGLKVLENADIPVVLMGTVPNSQLHSVDFDNAASARKAVDHLLKLGHQQIACITDAPLPYSSAAQRLNGYQQALQSAGIGFDETLVRYGDFDAESGYKAMQSLLEKKLNSAPYSRPATTSLLGPWKPPGRPGWTFLVTFPSSGMMTFRWRVLPTPLSPPYACPRLKLPVNPASFCLNC